MVAFVFPGQGSQSIGMLEELSSQYPIVKTLFNEVSEHVGYDVWHLTQYGPVELLNQTAQTQVAMLTADVAVFHVLRERAPLVDTNVLLAGHSLGEYAALVCAGALSLTDAAKLVQTRGQLMQSTVPLGEGAMAAIVGLTDEQVLALCDEVSIPTSMVSPANYNAIGQVVIAGHTAAVDKAIHAAEALNARLAKQIPVSVPCHCDLLRPAAEQFAKVLYAVSFQTPMLPVISTVDLEQYYAVDAMRALLAEQLYRPVRWVETIQLMKNQHVQLVLECGPGKVLSGLIKRIDKSLTTVSVNDTQSLQSALDQLTSMNKEVKHG
jgi:[acyl-carrier-protein] S-malonyltransferase